MEYRHHVEFIIAQQAFDDCRIFGNVLVIPLLIKKLDTWCREYCDGEFTSKGVGIHTKKTNWVCKFELESDAILFKLVWAS